jgi:hypothetical protein
MADMSRDMLSSLGSAKPPLSIPELLSAENAIDLQFSFGPCVDTSKDTLIRGRPQKFSRLPMETDMKKAAAALTITLASSDRANISIPVRLVSAR